MHARLHYQTRWLRLLVALIMVTGLIASTTPPGTAHAAPPRTFTNVQPFSIPSFGNATPYSSAINVFGVAPGSFSNIAVTLYDVEHTWPADIQVLLVGTNGRGMLLLDNNGGSTDITGLDLTFDERGEPLPISFAVPLATGTYQPNARPTPSFGNFGPPAPPPTYAANFRDLYAGSPVVSGGCLSVTGHRSTSAQFMAAGASLSSPPELR